jgi:hypothetical protein
MRTEQEIRLKFEEQFQKRLRERKKTYLSRKHENCRYNRRHRVRSNGMVSFCHCPDVLDKSGSFVYVCNDDEVAKNCEYYECAHTKESVQRDFDDILSNPALCGQKYPKLAVLVWCLQKSGERHEGTTTRLGRLLRLIWKPVKTTCESLRDFCLFRWW